MTAKPTANPLPSAQRGFWLKTLHQWHWISSALCLVGMLLFALTGITLNHAGQIEASPVVSTYNATVPENLLPLLQGEHEKNAPLPAEVQQWVQQALHTNIQGRDHEWNEGELYIALPRPGGDAWLSIDTETGEATHEVTTRGWVSWLNDLHKGRNTGAAWTWFIDIFSIAAIVFSITGFFLLFLHGRSRPATWPVVGLGVLIPLLLILLWMH